MGSEEVIFRFKESPIISNKIVFHFIPGREYNENDRIEKMELVVKTSQKRQVVDITDKVNEEIAKQNFKDGLCNLFLTHTTAALTTADLDPGTDQDYLDAFEEIIPKLNYQHPHDPVHTPDHILSTLIGTSLTLPVENGQLVLGTWQRVVLIEFDGPRDRQVVLSFT